MDDVPVPDALNRPPSRRASVPSKSRKMPAACRQNAQKDADKTDEEWRKMANAEEAQEKLDTKIEELKRQADDPATEPEEAAKLRQLAEQLEQMRQQLAGRQIDDKQWREMVRSDQMQAILRAAAKGEPLPDTPVEPDRVVAGRRAMASAAAEAAGGVSPGDRAVSESGSGS